MGLQEIQNERFENSEVMGKYWPKQDSEVLKYSTDKHGVSLPLPVAADEINKSEECNHRSLRPGQAVNQDTIKAPSRPPPAPPRTTTLPQHLEVLCPPVVPPSYGNGASPSLSQYCPSGHEAIKGRQSEMQCLAEGVLEEERRAREQLRCGQGFTFAKLCANFGYQFQGLFTSLMVQLSSAEKEVMVRGVRSSEGTQQQNKNQRNDQSRRQVFKSTKEFQKLLSHARRRVRGFHERLQRQEFEMLAIQKLLDQVRELESNCCLQKSFIVARGPDSALSFGPSTTPRIERGNAPKGGQEHVRQQKKKENLPQPVRGKNTTRVPPTAEGASTDGGRRRGRRGGQVVQQRRALGKIMSLWDPVNFRPWRRTWKEVCPTRESWGESVVNSKEDQRHPFLD